ncbi:MAG: hypothetical protein WAW13_00550 [Minisyncoccia bacterium]
MTEYEAAKARVKRFMEGDWVSEIYGAQNGTIPLRADLNLIAEHEGVQGGAFKTVDAIQALHRPAPPAITPRVYMVGQMAAAMAQYATIDQPGNDVALARIAVLYADAVLKEMGE